MYEIIKLSAEELQSHHAALIALLQNAVDGGASVSFMAPLDLAVATAFWDRVAAEIARGDRIVLAACDVPTGAIIGCAHLSLSVPPNSLHRADVQKMLVHSAYRRQGIGAALLAALEPEARQAGRTLLVLDTARGSGAESLYERGGYVRVGVIPNYALLPYGGLVDTVIYYKAL